VGTSNHESERGGIDGDRRAGSSREAERQKTQRAAKSKRTITHLTEATRRDVGKQASNARGRGGRAGRSLEDHTREQLYDLAKKRNIRGRSKMGKWDLVRALRA